MRFNLIRAGMVAAATILSVQSASAQTWYAAPTPTNSGTGAYWNNKSADNSTVNSVCNLGAVLMGSATDPQCKAEVPSNLLPLSNVQQLPGSGTRGAFLSGSSAMNPAAFEFTGGQYRFDMFGRIAGFAVLTAGVSPRIGYYEYTSLGARVLSEIVAAPGSSQSFTTSGRWGFWVGTFVPNTGGLNLFFSDMTTCIANGPVTGCSSSVTGPVTQQFALFSASVAGAPSASAGLVNSVPNDRFWIGAEDNGLISSDRDYQDVVGSFTQLPEPASIALFGTGLLGVLAVGRRRKVAK